jgi:hypothetical protein
VFTITIVRVLPDEIYRKTKDGLGWAAIASAMTALGTTEREGKFIYWSPFARKLSATADQLPRIE